MSFSGLKTAFRDLVQRGLAKDPDHVERDRHHLCAALQRAIVDILLRKVAKAAREQGLTRIALAGGVSANSALRQGTLDLCEREGWQAFIPPFAYCTDNAAMIAMAGHFLLRSGHRTALDAVPFPRA